MSLDPSELNQLAIEYVRLNDDADRTRKLAIETKAAAEIAERRASTAAGRLRDLMAKSSIALPITIAIPESDRLLTAHEHGFLVTTTPNPQ